MSDEYQLHLHSLLKYGSGNNFTCTEYSPVFVVDFLSFNKSTMTKYDI